MPGQWEFQIGPVGPLEVGDQVHLARYLLHRLGEDFQALASFNPKPMKGDWNGELPASGPLERFISFLGGKPNP